jgi:hypothetical protein
MTDCTARRFEFQGPGRRQLVASFDGGRLSSDGGAVLLREVDRQLQLIDRFAECFDDWRSPEWTEHGVADLLRQRVFGLALGYEDLNDHDDLRRDALLAACVGKEDSTGEDRRRSRDRGCPLAGKSTLHRLEWGLASEAPTDRYRRITVDEDAVDSFFVDRYIASQQEPPERVVLDFDATDDPLHGQQEGRYFHGYYDCYCYLPLYIFCGSHVLCARLRRSNIDASEGSVEELQRIVAQLREHWPTVKILVRGDSGFAREPLMAWCEDNGVDFVFGLARNRRLEAALGPALARVEQLCAASGEPERVYEELRYRTRKSWSRERRVIGKAEITAWGPNPRFVVTSLSRKLEDAQTVYRTIYCARGDAENRIKEQQLHLFATRTSARRMRVNQIRLWFSAVAYTLLDALRRLGLAGTAMANSYCGTLRTRLLKIGARVRVSVRRVWISLASAHPAEPIFAHAYDRLLRAGP